MNNKPHPPGYKSHFLLLRCAGKSGVMWLGEMTSEDDTCLKRLLIYQSMCKYDIQNVEIPTKHKYTVESHNLAHLCLNRMTKTFGTIIRELYYMNAFCFMLSASNGFAISSRNHLCTGSIEAQPLKIVAKATLVERSHRAICDNFDAVRPL